MTRIKDSFRNAKLLIIDDSRGDLLLARLAFERSGLTVDIEMVRSAEDGLRVLRHEDEYAVQRRPDLVLCDLNLPRMSGLEFLREVKADQVLRRIPVLILSSSTLTRDVDACYDSYASGYLAKPSSIGEFDEMVKLVEHYWFMLIHCPSDDNEAVRRCS